MKGGLQLQGRSPKYGLPMESRFDQMYLWQGNRRIMVECHSYRADTIRINYIDSTLEDLATKELKSIEKERLRQKSRESDSSGL